MKTHRTTILFVSAFAVAMAALESAVVVYLRALYYPGEFTVALRLIDERILLVEILREAATLVMLVTVGILAGKNFKERLAYFLLSFAVWDIFYYVWLKVFIDWPLTLLDWDILFLIPITWLGPVAAPLICAVTMIVFAGVLLQPTLRQSLSATAWSLILGGSAVILFTFIKDYGALMINNNFVDEYFTIMQNEDFIRIASQFIPAHYSWYLFWMGELMIVMGIFKVYVEQSTKQPVWSIQSIKWSKIFNG